MKLFFSLRKNVLIRYTLPPDKEYKQRPGVSLIVYLMLSIYGPVMVKLSPWAKSGSLAVFINKILFEHSHTNLFMNYLWLLSRYTRVQ